DDDVLLPVCDHDVRAVLVSTVSGVEPAVLEGLGRLLRLVPVTLEDVVGAREDLSLVVYRHADSDRGHAGARQPPRPLANFESVPLLRAAVDGQQGGGLGEAVDLNELPAELGLDTFDRPGWRGCAGNHHTHPTLAWHGFPARATPGCGIEHGRDHSGRAVEQSDAFTVDATQNVF